MRHVSSVQYSEEVGTIIITIFHLTKLRGELAPGSWQGVGFWAAGIQKPRRSPLPSNVKSHKLKSALPSARCFARCGLNCSQVCSSFIKYCWVQSDLLGSYFCAGIGAVSLSRTSPGLRRATCVCRVSAMVKCPVWGKFGNSPRRTRRPRNWAVDCSPCPFGSSISLLWEQEGKCHSAGVQSYRKDKSGVTLPEMLRTSPLQKKKLEQYSVMSPVSVFSGSDSFMQRWHWCINN